MEIKNFKMINKGSMLAKFDLDFPKMGMSIREFLLLETPRGKFISSPSRNYQDESGKKKYFNYIFFTEEKKMSFQKKCLELLEPYLKQEPASQTYVQEECPF